MIREPNPMSGARHEHPIGPYPPIVRAGPWLITSGQLGLAARDGPARPPLVEAGRRPADPGPGQRRATAADTGPPRSDVVKTTVFVTDMGAYAAVNEAYAGFFGDHRPARSVVGVAGLPMGAAVEVEAWAYLDRRPAPVAAQGVQLVWPNR